MQAGSGLKKKLKLLAFYSDTDLFLRLIRAIYPHFSDQLHL